MFNLAMYFVISFIVTLCLQCIAHIDGTISTFLDIEMLDEFPVLVIYIPIDFFHDYLYKVACIWLFEKYKMSPIILV